MAIFDLYCLQWTRHYLLQQSYLHPFWCSSSVYYGTPLFTNICTYISTIGAALKGLCHEIFMCWFYHQIASPGTIRGALGQFRFLPNIRGDIWI